MMSTTKRYLKVGHRKTKTGCFKCRARRVKCDEQKPVCTNCQRLGLPCGFPQESSGVSSPDENIAFGSSPVSGQIKRMELHLLHAYMSRGMVAPGGLGVASEWRNAWFVELPRLALKHDNLLYALLAFSAMQSHAASGPSTEMSLAQSEFWSLALQEQRNVVATDVHNHEATTLAAYFICMIAFGMIRERPLKPFTAPLSWFEVAQGALQVCPGEEVLNPDSRILHTTFQLTAPIRHGIAGPIDDLYQPILTYRLDEESQEYAGMIEEDTQAYKQALALITYFRRSVAEREPVYLHQRWICCFGQVIPNRFVIALRELRPRALVIMACFWAVLGNTEKRVLAAFGDAQGSIPKTEMLAIKENLPSSWHGLLQQPLDELSSVDG